MGRLVVVLAVKTDQARHRQAEKKAARCFHKKSPSFDLRSDFGGH